MLTRAFQIVSALCLVSSGVLAQSIITAPELQHHRWVLETINGDALPAVNGKGKVPELDFGEQMHVSGNTGCNQFNGQAVLRDGFFLIEAMTSTSMVCPPPWGDIELKLQTALGHESTISLDANKSLILRTAESTLIFRLKDWVAAAKITSDTFDRVARVFHARGSSHEFAKPPPVFGGRNSPAGEIDEVLTPAIASTFDLPGSAVRPGCLIRRQLLTSGERLSLLLTHRVQCAFVRILNTGVEKVIGR